MEIKQDLKLEWWVNTPISEKDATLTTKGPFKHQVYAWEACMSENNIPFIEAIVWCTIAKKTENSIESAVDSLFTDQKYFPCDISPRNRSYDTYT